MRTPKTPDHLRHVPAAFAFAAIAFSTVDPRWGSPVLGLSAAGVAVGLLCKHGFAKPFGAGLAASWLLFLVFPTFFPEWMSPVWACAGLGAIALGTLWFTPRFGRVSARGALACAAAGLMIGTLRWHGYDELWVLGAQLPKLGALALAGLLAFFRPREAAALVVGAAAMSVLGLFEETGWRLVPLLGASAWISEHALRAYEERPTAATRFERPAGWLAVATFLGLIGLTLRFTLSQRWIAGDDLAGLCAMVGLFGVVVAGFVRRSAWAAPLGVGLGLGALLWGGRLMSFADGWLPVIASVLLAPSLARLPSRRGLGLAGLGVALGAGVAFLASWGAHDDLGFGLLAAAAALVGLGVVGFARGRTWALLAAGAAVVPLYAAGVVFGQASLATMFTCTPAGAFPSALALGGVFVALAAYGGPVLRALREARVS